MGIIWILIALAVVYFVWNYIVGRKGSKKLTEVTETPATMLRARTSEQKKAIKYFTATGCLASLSKLSDEEYDAMVKSLFEKYGDKQRALKKLCIDESMVNEVKPLLVHGYDYENSVFLRYGKDDKWHASDYQFTWVFCGSEQVYFYSMTFSPTNGNTKETTDEYFYKDITNFEHTTRVVEKLWLGKGCLGRYSRRPVVADSFFISAMGVTRSCAMESNAETERQIQGLRSKLREKKNS